MLLTEAQLAIRDSARAFARKELVPCASEWDRTEFTPLAVLDRMGELGLMGVFIPEEWGGAGADFVAYVAAMEEIAYGDAGIANLMAVTNSPCAAALHSFGTQDQKEAYLRPLASGKKRGCFLLSEPAAGSDAANLKTRAVFRDGRYVINGTKNFITAAESAHIGLLFATVDPSAGKNGIACFLVDTKQAGFNVVRRESKLGHRSCDTCQVIISGLELPTSALLGEVGQGLKIALAGLGSGRIGVAAQSVGVAQAAFDAALAYAKERITFGKTLVEHQAIAFKLADMATKIEVARQAYLSSALLKDHDLPFIEQASMAKLFASEMVQSVTSDAIQVFGGYGYLNDYPVEKYFRDMRVFSIYDGTSEVQKMLIARELLKK
jgi:butyryl-CoA dehydrogenase